MDSEEEADNRIFYAVVTFILCFAIFHWFHQYANQQSKRNKTGKNPDVVSQKSKGKTKSKKKKKKKNNPKPQKSQETQGTQNANSVVQQSVSKRPLEDGDSSSSEDGSLFLQKKTSVSTKERDANRFKKKNNGYSYSLMETQEKNSSCNALEAKKQTKNQQTAFENHSQIQDAYEEKHYRQNDYAEDLIQSTQPYQQNTEYRHQEEDDVESSSSDDSYNDRMAILNSGKTIVADLGKKRPGTIKPRNKFSIDDTVEARYEGGQEYFPGKIAKVGPGLSYTVNYDDGERETKVAEHLIRFKNETVQPMDEFWSAPPTNNAGAWNTVPLPMSKEDKAKKKVVKLEKREENDANVKNRKKRAKKKEKEKLIREAMRKNL